MSALPIFFSTSSNVWKSVLYTPVGSSKPIACRTSFVYSKYCLTEVASSQAASIVSSMRSVTDGIPICFIIYEGERREKERERESQRAFIHSKLLGEEEEKSEEEDDERKKILLLLLLLPPPMMMMMMRYKEKRSPLP